MRKNHHSHSSASRLDTYDRVYIELPEGSNTATIIVIPMKTIYINQSASPLENVDRIFYGIEEAEAFTEMLGIE